MSVIHGRSVKVALVAAACAVLWPVAASAQTAVTGLVTDTTGAVLPGVTVEAASSVLIEKVRSAITDSQGRYNIADLRPGVYAVTFTLTGFNTVKRDGLELPANFAATVNAELKVGSVEETVTVTGASPVVDVQNVQQTQVVTRAVLDAIPTGRSFRSVAALISGVRPSTQSVGDSRPQTTQRPKVHGTNEVDTIVLLDGLTTNSLHNAGLYALTNDQAVQEISYGTSANTADVEPGGLRISMVPREGGNTLHGGGVFSDMEGNWQADNQTDALRARGLVKQNHTQFARDLNPWIGGPIRQDKIWFFGSYRWNPVAETVANSFYADGTEGTAKEIRKNYTARLTFRLSDKHKFSAYVDRAIKTQPFLMNPGEDPLTGSARVDEDHQFYIHEQVKWTSTLSTKVLFEAGAAMTDYAFFAGYQPGIDAPRGSAAWYGNVRRVDTVLGTATGAGTGSCNALGQCLDDPRRYTMMSSLSYVTGSHHVKTGFQWDFGRWRRTQVTNGDLQEVYLNRVPSFVDATNTPIESVDRLNAALGVYIQDGWTFKRLTLNAGLRFSYLNTSIDGLDLGAGRFVPARHFDDTSCMPCWKEITPRFGAAYDQFGNGRTALKLGINKYVATDNASYARRYNPMGGLLDRRTWRDCDFVSGTTTCSPLLLATNGDGIAQDNEIGPSNNRNFAAGTRTSRPDSTLDWPNTWEYTISVQQQVLPGFALSGAWYRRTYGNLFATINTLVSLSDYTPFQAANPLGNAETITIYNLNRAKQGLIDNLDAPASDSAKNRQAYSAVELNFSARLPGGATAFGGWNFERTVSVACTTTNPNALRFCDQSGDTNQDLGTNVSIPFRHNWKLAGSQPLPFAFQAAVALQNYTGTPLNVNWVVPAALFPGGQTQSVTVNLVPPGSKFGDRWNQLDVAVSRKIRAGKATLDVRLDVFNLLNGSPVFTENQTFGPALGQPLSILVGRIPRIGVQLGF